MPTPTACRVGVGLEHGLPEDRRRIRRRGRVQCAAVRPFRLHRRRAAVAVRGGSVSRLVREHRGRLRRQQSASQNARLLPLSQHLANNVVVTTTIRLRFDCNSNALRPLYVTAYLFWASALRPK